MKQNKFNLNPSIMNSIKTQIATSELYLLIIGQFHIYNHSLET